MPRFRAVALIAPLLALVASGVSAPSFATDTGAGSATAMLAAVTAPLLAVDVRTLEAAAPDFATPAPDAAPADTDGSTLESLVDANTTAAADDAETRCLATTIYYESKGEPLAGQLAVAQTIVNRTRSNTFPEGVCDVVRQPGQFSFLRGGALPEPPAASAAWGRAVAVARIAREGLWKQVAPAALYFHARRVAAGWGKVRVASIGNHVFFR